MLRFLGILLVICDFVVAGETAASLEELKDDYMETVLKCVEDYPLTDDQIKAIQRKDLPDSPAVKCFFACAYKKTGMMDDKGYLSIEGVRKISEKYISEDPDILRKSDQFTDACKSVNDFSVSDGAEGCERAAMIYKCTIQKAPEFDLVA